MLVIIGVVIPIIALTRYLADVEAAVNMVSLKRPFQVTKKRKLTMFLPS